MQTDDVERLTLSGPRVFAGHSCQFSCQCRAERRPSSSETWQRAHRESVLSACEVETPDREHVAPGGMCAALQQPRESTTPRKTGALNGRRVLNSNRLGDRELLPQQSGPPLRTTRIRQDGVRPKHTFRKKGHSISTVGIHQRAATARLMTHF
jgi:hypothetical protein